MDNLLTVAFEAHNAEKNHHRRYAGHPRPRFARRLDGCHPLRPHRPGRETARVRQPRSPTRCGRSSATGCGRRLSAPKRIGCPYRLAAFSTAPGFDASAWLPGEVMARFFALA